MKTKAEHDQLRSLAYALGAVVLWSTVATAFKLSLNGLNSVQLLFYSSLSSCVVLFFTALMFSHVKIISVFSPREIGMSVVQGLLNPFLYYLVLFKAYSLLPAYEAQPLNYTWPIVLSLMSTVAFKQRLKLSVIIGLIFAFTGVVIIATRGDIMGFQFHNSLGVLLAVGSSLIWATYWILSLKDKREASLKLFGAFLCGTVFSAIYILLFDSFRVEKPVYIFGAVYVGLFEMGITFFLWLKGLSLSSNNAKTSTLAYLSPFLSLIFIAVILNEKISMYSVTGLILIIGGIVFQQFGNKKE